jgi:cytochrome P450
MTIQYPPGPRHLLPFTVIKRFRSNPIGLLTELAKDYGDCAHVRIGAMHLVALSHPDDIEEVLVRKGASFSKSPTLKRARRLLGNGLLTSEEPTHRCQQRRMTSAFSMEKIRMYDDVVVDYTQRLVAQWRDGMSIDFAETMKRLTLSVIGKVLFGDDFESEAPAIERDFSTALDRLRPFRPPSLASLHFTEWIPGTKGWQFRQARNRLDAIVLRLIQQRRAQPHPASDLLSILLSGKDDEAVDDQGMVDGQARDETVTLILAGHETVAHALAWTWYLLAKHPEVEAKLHQELDAVLGGALPTVEHQPALPYARMVLSESMRLFPPVWVIARQALEECTIGRFRLPAGTVVSMSQFVVHHDSRWYPDPERFDPERWAPARETRMPKHAYFPFGSGSRHCLGERFAWMEATLILAMIAQKWRACLAPGAKVEMDPGFTLRPRFGVHVTLKSRSATGQ